MQLFIFKCQYIFGKHNILCYSTVIKETNWSDRQHTSNPRKDCDCQVRVETSFPPHIRLPDLTIMSNILPSTYVLYSLRSRFYRLFNFPSPKQPQTPGRTSRTCNTHKKSVLFRNKYFVFVLPLTRCLLSQLRSYEMWSGIKISEKYVYSSTLKMDVAGSSKTSIRICQSTRCHTDEGRRINIYI